MQRFLKRAFLGFVPAALAALVLGASASAGPDGGSAAGVTSPALLALIGNDDLFSTTDLSTVLAAPMTPGANATQHYGPYTSSSPDSGTCGNDWATDTFDRHFSVKPNNDGTFTVVEQFKKGSFVTNAGPSPGACQPLPNGGMIAAGKTGDMHGYFIIDLAPGTVQTSQDPSCVAGAPTAPCTTTDFIATHFSSGAYDVSTFFFHYSAGDQGLIQHEWKNASDDRGGNSGDIRSS